jgi:hypothetical protein
MEDDPEAPGHDVSTEQLATYEHQLVELLRKCREHSTKLKRDELASVFSGDSFIKRLILKLKKIDEDSEFLEQSIDRIDDIETAFLVIEDSLNSYEYKLSSSNMECKFLYISAASLSMVLLGTITSATSSK